MPDYTMSRIINHINDLPPRTVKKSHWVILDNDREALMPQHYSSKKEAEANLYRGQVAARLEWDEPELEPEKLADLWAVYTPDVFGKAWAYVSTKKDCRNEKLRRENSARLTNKKPLIVLARLVPVEVSDGDD